MHHKINSFFTKPNIRINCSSQEFIRNSLNFLNQNQRLCLNFICKDLQFKSPKPILRIDATCYGLWVVGDVLGSW